MPEKVPGAEANPPQPARYERVQQILDDAAGGVCPSYQGYGRFWRLPLAEFLNVTIYGVRMIARPGASAASAASSSGAPTPSSSAGGDQPGMPVMSCCHEDSTPPAAPAEPEQPPEQPDDDCYPTPDRGGKKKRYPGRGAASGLIKGLKGEYPFDGSQFPRLPWGGKEVARGDIQFISDWIDDGAPATDEERPAIEVRESLIAARARGDEDHPLSPRTVNDHRHESGVLKARKNIEFLSPDELQRFRRAIACMQRFNRFPQDERSFVFWAQIHANSCEHGWEEFLTWHRLYLYYFEQHLQDIDPSVTLPYWDWVWSYDQENFDLSLQDMSLPQTDITHVDNGLIPEAYRCWVDEAAIKRLSQNANVWKEDLKKLGKKVHQPGDDNTFSSGSRLFKAAGIVYGQNPNSDNAIMTELQNVNPLWYRQRWPGGNQSVIFEAYPKPADITNILQPENFFAFGSGPDNHHFFGALEQIHNLIHNYSGGVNPYAQASPNSQLDPPQGDMTAPTHTAFDPIFWGHHSNVDRLWAEWQKLHPNKPPDNPTAVLPPWKMTVADTFNTANLGYEYLMSSHLYETENTVPITRFKSAPAKVHPHVLANHRGAEIRLHKVQYSVNGGTFIRVFLNAPRADANTPTKGNDNFVGQVALFSGGCIGGPGHCDPPPETRRKFDHRPRHRKTPSNIRLDATDTVQKLRAKGETDLHINLVVLDITGQQKSDALWLDAVSLNFID